MNYNGIFIPATFVVVCPPSGILVSAGRRTSDLIWHSWLVLKRQFPIDVFRPMEARGNPDDEILKRSGAQTINVSYLEPLCDSAALTSAVGASCSIHAAKSVARKCSGI